MANIWRELVPPGDSSREIGVLGSIDRANYIFEGLGITPSMTSMRNENILCWDFKFVMQYFMTGDNVSNIASVFKGLPIQGRNYFSNILETLSNKPAGPRLNIFDFSFTGYSLWGPDLGGVLKLGTHIYVVGSFFNSVSVWLQVAYPLGCNPFVISCL